MGCGLLLHVEGNCTEKSRARTLMCSFCIKRSQALSPFLVTGVRSCVLCSMIFCMHGSWMLHAWRGLEDTLCGD